jgi:type II secretory pathway component PulJ
MRHKIYIKQEGMTLVEMMVLIGIYVVLMLAINMSIFNLYQTNAYSFAQANEIDNARRGVTQWYRDVREMVIGEDGTYPIAVIDEHRFGYYSDTDQDDSVEYVEYVLATTTLSKYTYNATGNPALYDLLNPDLKEDLSYYVQNINQATSTFFYYDNAGNQLSSTSPIIDVRYIEMQLIVNIDPIKSPGEFMLRSSVAPRNLKDNL